MQIVKTSRGYQIILDEDDIFGVQVVSVKLRKSLVSKLDFYVRKFGLSSRSELIRLMIMYIMDREQEFEEFVKKIIRG